MRCYLLIRQEVKEYSNWRIMFDNALEWRCSKGEKSFQVFQDVNNQNTVTILLEWENMQSAKKFIADTELSELMQHAGVTQQPIVYFLEKD